MKLRLLSTVSVTTTVLIVAACSGGERPPVGEAVVGPAIDAGRGVIVDSGADAAVAEDGGGDAGSSVPGAFGGFDPNEIYLQGTLAPGAAGWEVIGRLSEGNNFAAGFDAFGARYGWVHPTDGFVYVSDDNSVHKFVADPSPTYKTDGKNITWDNYPKNARANDPVITMLPCTNDVRSFYIRPDDSTYLHICRDSDTVLRNAAGDTVATLTSELNAVGYGGGLLLIDKVIDTSGVAHPLAAGVSSAGIAFRAKSDGTFYVATTSDKGFALWNVALDGSATKLYDYATLAGFGKVNADVRGWIAMDSQARLYRWGFMSNSTDDVVARFDDKVGELVYDESKVFMKMHASWMVSGP